MLPVRFPQPTVGKHEKLNKLKLNIFFVYNWQKATTSKLWQLYDNTGIECRYNCEPIEWYLRPHSWEERTESFRRHALDLLEQITVKTTEAAGVALNDVDMIVTNTVTGLAIPSLDAMLLNRLKLAP